MDKTSHQAMAIVLKRCCDDARLNAARDYDESLRHSVAALVSDLPSSAHTIDIVRWTDIVDDFGGHQITLERVFDVDGNVVDDLTGKLSTSSAWGTTDNIFAGPHHWAADDSTDQLLVSKVLAWSSSRI